MSDQNLYNKGYTGEVPSKNRCCLYERLPLDNAAGRCEIYALSLSPGHTLGDEPVGAEQTADLLQSLLCNANADYLLHPETGQVMVQAAPTADWLRYRDRISEKHLIIRLPDSYHLAEGEERVMLGLKRVGAEFAMTLGELGDLPKHPELLRCLDYVLIDHRNRSGLMTAFNGLKTVQKDLRSIGFKPYGQDFTIEESSHYDLVLGYVTPEPITYEKRPAWQHELIRTVAELFSGIFSFKDISTLARRYPAIQRAMKGIMNSKKIMELTGRADTMVQGGQRCLSQKDLTSLLCVCVGYGLICEAEKAVYERHGLSSRFSYDGVELSFFWRALIAGRMLESLSEQPCDDYESRHAFMVGFLSQLPALIHDTAENCLKEFMLTAVSSFFTGTSTLALVFNFLKAVRAHDSANINVLTTRSGLMITKEEYYSDYYNAMIWADTVIKAILAEPVRTAAYPGISV